MEKVLYMPDGENSCETTVRNSRFIGYAVPVSDSDEARRLIREKRKEHPGCTHVVYAFMAGGENTEVSGMSDDGEPRGTAGRPVMEILKGSGIINVLVMVVRYFGGTKLGTGGLVKAYGDCARLVLSGLATRPLVEKHSFELEIPYNLHKKIRDVILEAGGEIGTEDFSDNILMAGFVPERSVEECRKRIEDISRGALSL